MSKPAAPPVEGQKAGTSFRRWWERAQTSLFWIMAIGLALRLGYILVAHTYKFKADSDNFGFGWEMGRIGRALARGRGFADPFAGETGPTAWEPPVYPFLVAAVFRLTGIYSQASAVMVLGLNSIFSTLTCIPIFLVARK